MEPLTLIERYYQRGTPTHRLLVAHSRQVAELAVRVAERQTGVDDTFVSEAAWLHDIGIYLTDTAEFGCHGDAHYLEHGVLGAELLRKAGLPRHALVCERHIGVGLTVEDIRDQALPLPLRDMRPQTTEEEIVAYADLFFSKRAGGSRGPRSVEEVRQGLARFGEWKVAIFDGWQQRFGR